MTVLYVIGAYAVFGVACAVVVGVLAERAPSEDELWPGRHREGEQQQ